MSRDDADEEIINILRSIEECYTADPPCKDTHLHTGSGTKGTRRTSQPTHKSDNSSRSTQSPQ